MPSRGNSAYSVVTHFLYNNILNRKYTVIRMAVSLKYDLMRILLKYTIWGQGGTSGGGALAEHARGPGRVSTEGEKTEE